MKLVLPNVNDDGWNDITGRHFVQRTSGSTLQPLKKPRLSSLGRVLRTSPSASTKSQVQLLGR